MHIKAPARIDNGSILVKTNVFTTIIGIRMDRLRALRYFAKLAQTLSFSETADHFRVPSSSVSRRIKDLEAGGLGFAFGVIHVCKGCIVHGLQDLIRAASR